MKQILFNYDTEYASESMSFIPSGYIDKSICACGITTVALENNRNVVLAVPTITLALNKADQYPNERSNYSILPIWGDTSTSEIQDYIKKALIKKFICTYDSLPKLDYLLPDCHLVIDESNILLPITKQRPAVVDRLLDIALRYKDTVSFVSATPLPVEYLPSWVSDIDQIKITWNNIVKATPIICERTYPFRSLCEEFLFPLNRTGTMTVSGKTFSKVIVFMNTVSQITKVIKDTGLDKEDCGIICGDSLKNDVKISGIERYKSGPLPKYLFLTSSGFYGIDLVDEDAMTIIVSNTSKNWQMIDMLTNLKQAVSRQRNKSNPNYGSYIYIYNQSVFSEDEEELLQRIEDVREKIALNIPHYDDLKRMGKETAFMCDNDFKAYSLFKDGRYILNEGAFNADKYFILQTRRQYAEGFDIRGCIGNGETIGSVSLPKSVRYKDLVDYFEDNNVKGEIEWGPYSTRYEWIRLIEDSFRFYKKVWKDFTYAKSMIDNYNDTHELVKMDIKRQFSVGSSYSRNQVKEILKEIYCSHKIERIPQHYDLQDALIIKEKKINGERMVEILGKKK